jgi:hypothetical protein
MITAEQRRWVLLNSVLGTALVNLVVNSGIALFGSRGQHHIPAWSISVAHPSVMTDGLGVLITLPIITCLLVSLAVRRELMEARLGRLDPAAFGRAPFLAVPGALRRGLRFAAVTFGAFAIPLTIAMELTARSGLSHDSYVGFHVALTVILGAIVTPFIALAAMTDEPALISAAEPALLPPQTP